MPFYRLCTHTYAQRSYHSTGGSVYQPSNFNKKRLISGKLNAHISHYCQLHIFIWEQLLWKLRTGSREWEKWAPGAYWQNRDTKNINKFRFSISKSRLKIQSTGQTNLCLHVEYTKDPSDHKILFSRIFSLYLKINVWSWESLPQNLIYISLFDRCIYFSFFRFCPKIFIFIRTSPFISATWTFVISVGAMCWKIMNSSLSSIMYYNL